MVKRDKKVGLGRNIQALSTAAVAVSQAISDVRSGKLTGKLTVFGIDVTFSAVDGTKVQAKKEK